MIIAEIGINHNGNLHTALELIRVAKQVGADAVKFQYFTNISHLKKYELAGYEQDVNHLKQYCDKINITFLSTPHTFDAIQILDNYVDIFKIASPYLGVPNFLKEVASKNKPILLSTGSVIHNNGMASIEEIQNALSFIPNADVTLLHCVSKYPCKNGYYERIDELKNLGYSVGLSDHTKNIKLPKGLPVYEKHIMLDNDLCIDRKVSLSPTEFKEMVKWLNFL